jgi:hypothetical protein
VGGKPLPLALQYSLMHKKPELFKSWPFDDPFGLFFCQLHLYLLKNWASDDHFDVPNMPKSYLDQKLWHKTKFPVFCNFVKKNTENLWLINSQFRIISGHFLANYMKIFHKKEVQMVILRCLVCLNLNWIKSYNLILVKIIFLSFLSWLVSFDIS